MRPESRWHACLALCLVAFSARANAVVRVQCPDKCSPQKTGVKTLAQLKNNACTDKTAFVFEVQLENAETSLSTDAYNMSILTVFKSDSDSPFGENRVFISRPSCKSSLSLKPSKVYLIMGGASSVKKVDGRYHYMFDDNTWLQYWPTDDEGLTKTYSSQYNNLEEFRADMGFGC